DRIFKIDRNAKLGFKLADDYIEMLLSQARNQRLSGFRMYFGFECAVFILKSLKSRTYLVIVPLRFRFDRKSEGGPREFYLCKNDRIGLVAKRIVCVGILQ